MTSQKIIKVHCNSCSQETNHKVVNEHKNKDFEEMCSGGFSVDGHYVWRTVECMGCELVHLISKEYFSEWCEPNYDNNPNYDPYLNKHYPPRNIEARPKPKWYSDFQSRRIFASIIHGQIYQIIEDCPEVKIATMLLIRSLLEAVVIEKVGDAESFEKRLRRLKDQNLITESDVINLNEEVYDAGSAAMHRMYNPSLEVINSALNAVEHLIFKLYFSEDDMRIIKNEKPIRVIKNKNNIKRNDKQN